MIRRFPSGSLFRSRAPLDAYPEPDKYLIMPVWVRNGQIMLYVGNVSFFYAVLVGTVILYVPWWYNSYLEPIGP